MVLLKNKIKKIKYTHTLNALQNVSSDNISKLSEETAIRIFKQTARTVPFYKNYLEEHCPDHSKIDDIKSFSEQVPLVDKDIIFTKNKDTIENIFQAGTINNIKSFLLSSGFTGNFSFGVNTQREISASNQFIEILFHYYFNTLEEKTLIINCLSQAVKLPAIDIAVAEIGPKADSLLYLLKTVSNKFSQTIIIGDNYFIKNALETGLEEKINFSKLKINLILGGTYLPENLRTHLAEILQISQQDQNSGIILSSMGISEFGLNLFFESRETIALRKMAQKDTSLRETLLNNQYPYLPMFFNFFPQLFFMEEINNDIIITNLNSSTKLPLVRYNTQDKGKIIPYVNLKNLLKEFNANEFLPPFKSPLALIYGKEEFITIQNQKIYPQQIQESLYANFETAASTTGCFHITAEGNLGIQLKKGISITADIKNKFQQAVFSNINTDLLLTLYHYPNFPHSMELDYERKFRYI